MGIRYRRICSEKFESRSVGAYCLGTEYDIQFFRSNRVYKKKRMPLEPLGNDSNDA